MLNLKKSDAKISVGKQELGVGTWEPEPVKASKNCSCGPGAEEAGTNSL